MGIDCSCNVLQEEETTSLFDFPTKKTKSTTNVVLLSSASNSDSDDYYDTDFDDVSSSISNSPTPCPNNSNPTPNNTPASSRSVNSLIKLNPLSTLIYSSSSFSEPTPTMSPLEVHRLKKMDKTTQKINKKKRKKNKNKNDLLKRTRSPLKMGFGVSDDKYIDIKDDSDEWADDEYAYDKVSERPWLVNNLNNDNALNAKFNTSKSAPYALSSNNVKHTPHYKHRTVSSPNIILSPSDLDVTDDDDGDGDDKDDHRELIKNHPMNMIRLSSADVSVPIITPTISRSYSINDHTDIVFENNDMEIDDDMIYTPPMPLAPQTSVSKTTTQNDFDPDLDKDDVNEILYTFMNERDELDDDDDELDKLIATNVNLSSSDTCHTNNTKDLRLSMSSNSSSKSMLTKTNQ